MILVLLFKNFINIFKRYGNITNTKEQQKNRPSPSFSARSILLSDFLLLFKVGQLVVGVTFDFASDSEQFHQFKSFIDLLHEIGTQYQVSTTQAKILIRRSKDLGEYFLNHIDQILDWVKSGKFDFARIEIANLLHRLRDTQESLQHIANRQSDLRVKTEGIGQDIREAAAKTINQLLLQTETSEKQKMAALLTLGGAMAAALVGQPYAIPGALVALGTQGYFLQNTYNKIEANRRYVERLGQLAKVVASVNTIMKEYEAILDKIISNLALTEQALSTS